MNLLNQKNFEFHDSKGRAILIRDYQPKDAGFYISVLDETRSIGTHWGLDLTSKKYDTNMQNSLKQNADRIILVAEDISQKERSKIIGTVYLQTTFVIYHNKRAKLGHVSGLKVEGEYRNAGIGAELMKALEKRAKDNDVELLDLWASKVNSTALKLFEKLEYSRVLEEGLCINPIRQRQFENVITIDNEKVKVNFEKIEKKESREYLEKYYANADLKPRDWSELLDAEECQGTYILSTPKKDIVAGFVLCRPNPNKVYFAQSMLTSLTYGNKYIDYGYIYLVTLGLMGGIFGGLTALLGIGKLISAGVSLLSGYGFLSIYHKIKHEIIIKSTGVDESKSDYVVAPFYFGPENRRLDMTELLLCNMREVSRRDGKVMQLVRGDNQRIFDLSLEKIEYHHGYHMLKSLNLSKDTYPEAPKKIFQGLN